MPVMANQEQCGSTAPGSEEVVQPLRKVAIHNGGSFACERLELAGQAGDFDVADCKLSCDVASTLLNP